MERQPSGKCDRHGALLRQLLVSHGGVLAQCYGSGRTKVLLLHFWSLCGFPGRRVTEATTSREDYYDRVQLSVKNKKHRERNSRSVFSPPRRAGVCSQTAPILWWGTWRVCRLGQVKYGAGRKHVAIPLEANGSVGP